MDREFTDSYMSRPVELPLGREGGRRGERMGEEAEIETCFNLSKQRYCITFLPLLSLSAPGGMRCWLLRCFCPVAGKMDFWETWVGRRRSDQQHQVSRCFLHWCLLFVYLQNERHGHLFLYPKLISSCSSHCFVLGLCFPPRFSQLTSSSAHMKAPELSLFSFVMSIPVSIFNLYWILFW